MDLLKSDTQNELRLSQLQRECRKEAAGIAVEEILKFDSFLNNEKHNGFKDGIKCKSRTIVFHLNQLEIERDFLDNHLLVAYGKEHEENEERIVQQIQIQLKTQEQMKAKISSLKIEIKQIQSQVVSVENKEILLSTKTESEDLFCDKLRKSRIQLRNFESRLENMQQREGTARTENERLRLLIQNMISDRYKFNNFWFKYIASLSHNKKFLLDMIERAVLAFNQGEDLCLKLDSLRYHSSIEKRKNIDLMLKKKRQQDANQKMYDFLGGKGNKREILPLEKRELERRSEFKRTYDQKLNFYKLLIQNIQEFSGETSIIQSMQKYGKQDDEFFSTYNYMLEMNSIIELTSQSLKDVNDNYSASNEGNMNFLTHSKNHEHLLNQTLKRNIEATLNIKSNRDKCEKQILGYLKTINEIMVSLLSMLLKSTKKIIFFQVLLKCDLSSYKSLLGNYKEVTIYNLHVFLAQLEQRTNSIIAFVYCDQRNDEQLTFNAVNNQMLVKNVQRNLNHPVKNEDIVLMQQCAECAQGSDVNRYDVETIYPMDFGAIKETVRQKVQTAEMCFRLHSISQCRLPRSRTIVNRRYL